MLTHHSKLFVLIATFALVVLGLLSLQTTIASPERRTRSAPLLAHPVSAGTPTPTPPSQYSLPFNRVDMDTPRQ